MPRRIAVLTGLLAAGALGIGTQAGAAGIVTPPAGTPNLALMVLQPADLVPGAVIVSQGYVTAPVMFVADYGSVFGLAQTSDGTKFDAIEDFVALAPDSTQATFYFAGQASLFGTAAGRKRLVKNLIKTSPKRDHLKPKDISFTAAGPTSVGQSSFIETINFDIRHVRFQQVVLLYDAGTIDVSMVLTGVPNEQLPQSDAITLGGTIASHIQGVLGATGATGTT
jgi:hypothetical protein